MAKRLGIENKKIRRGKGPVDLLTGIDHARLHKAKQSSLGSWKQARHPWDGYCSEAVHQAPRRPIKSITWRTQHQWS